MIINEINTNRLILRIESEKKAQDILDFYLRNQELFDKYEPTRINSFNTVSYHRAASAYEHSETSKNHMLRYYVYLKSNPEYIIGTVSFANIIPRPFSKASIGYKFDENFHNKGYALEACNKALEIIKSYYKIHRVEAHIMPENASSIKLITKLGFSCEGIERSSVEINGQWQDHVKYAIIFNENQ